MTQPTWQRRNDRAKMDSVVKTASNASRRNGVGSIIAESLHVAELSRAYHVILKSI